MATFMHYVIVTIDKRLYYTDIYKHAAILKLEIVSDTSVGIPINFQ